MLGAGDKHEKGTMETSSRYVEFVGSRKGWLERSICGSVFSLGLLDPAI